MRLLCRKLLQRNRQPASAEAPVSKVAGSVEAAEQKEIAYMRLLTCGLLTWPPLAFAQDKIDET